jgi:hypothetical protein
MWQHIQNLLHSLLHDIMDTIPETQQKLDTPIRHTSHIAPEKIHTYFTHD